MGAASSFHDSKPHFQSLDGLRGVVALIVLAYHLFESFATSQVDQVVNHGYLAVDFFFLLSGFVIGYAYDDRLKSKRMSRKDFFKRRLIRLHPMVIMGAIIGALCFYFAEYEPWNVRSIRLIQLFWGTILTALLIPVSPQYEIRGNGEMYPLNGPYWSLFFEYIVNILYLYILRKLPTRLLTIVVVLLGLSISAFALFGPFGGIGAGWTMDADNILGGILRVLFSFSLGMLITRKLRPRKFRGGFWIATVLMIIFLGMPRIGGEERFIYNGLYELFCILLLFPMLLILGASDSSTDAFSRKTTRFLGDLSYPLYVVHYPFLYLYYSYVKVHHLTFWESLPEAALFYFGSIVVAYILFRVYDIPVRRYLTQRFISKKTI